VTTTPAGRGGGGADTGRPARTRNEDAIKGAESFMSAFAIPSPACSAPLSAILPIVLLVGLASDRRKAEASAWPAGL